MTDSDANDMPSKGPFWRVSVKDFGRVASADIEMAPLVVLLGRNNTGKSYIASLLWAMMNFSDMFLSSRNTLDALPEWYQTFARDADIFEPEETKVDRLKLTDWINSLVSERRNEVAARLLSLRSTEIGNLDVTISEECPEVILARIPPDESSSASASLSMSDTSGSNKLTLSLWSKPDFHPTSFLSRNFQHVIDAVLLGNFPDGAAAYIPAARTGLMLALRPLLASALQTLGIEEKPRTDRLPLPTIRFLQSLANYEPDDDADHAGIADFLESAILHGRIVNDSEGSEPNYSYMTDTNTVLPLHASSSMVTELAPLLLLLRSDNFGRGLVFEEPEAHMHLAAQRSMARAIMRMVSSGVPVVITTHSDTFVQELNLLMQIATHDDRDALKARYGYSDSELVESRHVRAYEFIETEGRTFVTPAEVGRYGIVAHSLNETLGSIANEVIAVQSNIDDAQ